ncbi:hypothetical protein [Chitinilyticum litopenaei]|uniref:hypothetical protein n=1 Tax=Chitinilyticum litopenaei TaxID=1121276 RepID=UPI001186BD9B|nr:hypothetical protein [Chitinilyticum litopenaei]
MDFSLVNTPALLSANKSEEYQQQILTRQSAIVHFLVDNNLLVNIPEPFDERGIIKKDLIIRMSNVKNEGIELFKKAIPSWLRNLDKGGDIANTKKLSQELEKIRSKTP